MIERRASLPPTGEGGQSPRKRRNPPRNPAPTAVRSWPPPVSRRLENRWCGRRRRHRRRIAARQAGAAASSRRSTANPRATPRPDRHHPYIHLGSNIEPRRNLRRGSKARVRFGASCRRSIAPPRSGSTADFLNGIAAIESDRASVRAQRLAARAGDRPRPRPPRQVPAARSTWTSSIPRMVLEGPGDFCCRAMACRHAFVLQPLAHRAAFVDPVARRLARKPVAIPSRPRQSPREVALTAVTRARAQASSIRRRRRAAPVRCSSARPATTSAPPRRSPRRADAAQRRAREATGLRRVACRSRATGSRWATPRSPAPAAPVPAPARRSSAAARLAHRIPAACPRTGARRRCRRC